MELIIDNLKSAKNKLFGPYLNEEELQLHKEEQKAKTIGNIRFANILVVVMVALFGIIDYFSLNASSNILKLTIIRVIFLLAIILPLYLISFKEIYQRYFSAFLFLNTLSYLAFLHILAWISADSNLALLHIYIGIIVVIITMHLLLGMSHYSSLILSIISILMSNYVILGQHLQHTISIPVFHLNLWFIIVTILAYTFSLYFESFAKLAFLMQQKLKEENALKNKFFGVVAHDLKNMIASQYSIAEYLNDNHIQMNEQKRTDMLSILNQSASNVMEVFEDLMQWIKAQLETIVIHNKDTSIRNLISTITDLMEPAALNKSIRLKTNKFEDYNINTDANLLGLVIRNILGNAIKFSQELSSVEIIVESQSNVSEIQIIDSGVGMNQQIIEQIFKLDRIDSTPGTNGETGTGLGLILSKELLTVLKGELIIESYLGKGTTITILIPNS